MRIAIITQPLHNNYGGLLQNYALQYVLKERGHDVVTIDWRPAGTGGIKDWLWAQKQLLLYYFCKSSKKPRYILSSSEASIISKNTNDFINTNISICPHKAHNINDFHIIDNKYQYDAYLVGSDQVWRPGYNNCFMPAMFLCFVNRTNVKRVAYAASFGTSKWEFTQEMTEKCSRLIKQFNKVTVREDSGVELCREYLGVSAEQVLDPTMLLKRSVYESLVSNANEPQSIGSLFHYLLDPNESKYELVNELAVNGDLCPFTVMPKCQAENRTRWDVKHRINDCVFPTVTSWLRGFMDAKMVVVDSFHGAVFSIIFNKPFWVIGNDKRGNARFQSLLKTFQLEERLITPQNKKSIIWDAPIEWPLVNRILISEQKKSFSIIDKFLI